MGTCADFVSQTSDAVCLQEFLSVLPAGVRGALAGVVDALTITVQAENFLAGELDRLLNYVVDQADEEVAGALMVLQPLFFTIDKIAPFIAQFATCPSVGVIVNSVLSPVIGIQNTIRSSTWRKDEMKDLAVAGTSKISNAIFSAAQSSFPDTTGKFETVAEQAADTFNSIRDCIGALGPPFLP